MTNFGRARISGAMLKNESTYSISKNFRFLQRGGDNRPEIAKLTDAIERKASCHAVLKNSRCPLLERAFCIPRVVDDRAVAAPYNGLQCEARRRLSANGHNSDVSSP